MKNDIKRKNYIRLGMECKVCHKIYGIDHPMKETTNQYGMKTWVDDCAGKIYYWDRTFMIPDYNHFKINEKWYKVPPKIRDKFLSMIEIDEAIDCQSLYRPSPVIVPPTQKALYALAEKLGVEALDTAFARTTL